MPTTNGAARKLAVIAAVPLLVGLFVGCSAGGDSKPTKTEDAAALTDQQAYDAWQIKFASCLEGKGYEMPPAGEGLPFDDSPEWEADAKACQDEIGPPPGGTPSQQEMDAQYEQMLAMFACLRERGYDLEDPKRDGVVALPSGVAPEDMAACSPEGGSGGGLSAS